MKIVLLYHSLVSDWNHGNAHFLRGITTELLARGHDVQVYEPANSWSVENLVAEHGTGAIEAFRRAYPHLHSKQYQGDADLDPILDGADLVIVHEWNAHDVVRRIGEHRASTRSYRLLFHDTHHRGITAREQMEAYDLSNYDGVLAYGEVLRQLYIEEAWTQHAWTWHEAADTRIFRPHPEIPRTRDLVWIGNWGDEERSAELHEFLIGPVRTLGLDATVYGVRYPKEGRAALEEAGVEYGGWLPNFRAPQTFASYRMTVHVPRRPYVQQLRGIPTIRPFEALACGIPLISAPWDDVEGLFVPGRDFLVAKNEAEMQRTMQALLTDKAMAREVAEHGLATIRARHTCGHRADQLLAVYEELERP